MKQKSAKKNMAFYLAVGISAVGFFLVFCVLPYTMDDWAWGSDAGIARLKSGFDGYNGRYLGNLVTLALTRIPIIKSVFMTEVTVLLCTLFTRLISKGKSVLAYAASVAVLLSTMLPGLVSEKLNIFDQTVGWASGFGNYAIPTLCVLFYLYITENLEIKPSHLPLASLCAFGAASALFVEHITLCFVAFSFICIFVYKEQRTVHISVFIGSLVGAVIMFSNSSYAKMLAGSSVNDGMRGIGFVDRNALKTLSSQLGLPLKAVIALCVFALLAAVVMFILPFVLKGVKDRKSLLLPLVCALIMTAFLLFANGGSKAYLFTARLYLTQYLLAAVYFIRLAKIYIKPNKIIKVAIVTAAVVLVIFTAVIYANINEVNRDMLRRIEQTRNDKIVQVAEYPDFLKRFVYMPDAYSAPEWERHFKRFYSIPDDKPLSPLVSNYNL